MDRLASVDCILRRYKITDSRRFDVQKRIYSSRSVIRAESATEIGAEGACTSIFYGTSPLEDFTKHSGFEWVEDLF